MALIINNPDLEVQVQAQASAVGLTVEEYIQLLVNHDRAELLAAIGAALSDVSAGRVHPAREALTELGSKLGLSS